MSIKDDRNLVPEPTAAVLVERHDAVALIILNRPERLNALSHALLVELRGALRGLGQDRSVRALVLTGAGRAFSSGADLRGGPSDAEEVVRRFYNPLITDLQEMDKPIVAAVNGVAAGAGVSLALACDLRVASEAATFQLSFVNVGLVPDAGATWMLPRAIGTARAAEMALLGRAVGAHEADSWGLVNRVVSSKQVVAAALDLARAAASVSSSIGAIRHLLHDGLGRDLGAQLEAEATEQGRAQHRPDYAEARLAFAEKRPPVFCS